MTYEDYLKGGPKLGEFDADFEGAKYRKDERMEKTLSVTLDAAGHGPTIWVHDLNSELFYKLVNALGAEVRQINKTISCRANVQGVDIIIFVDMDEHNKMEDKP